MAFKVSKLVHAIRMACFGVTKIPVRMGSEHQHDMKNIV